MNEGGGHEESFLSLSFFFLLFFFFSPLPSVSMEICSTKRLLFFYNRYLMTPKCLLGSGFECGQVSNLGHSMTDLPGKACH